MRVLKYKAGLNDGILPIERHAIKENHAFRIDENLYVFELKDVVARAWFRSELKLVAQPRTTSTQNAQPQTTHYAFASEGGTDFLNSFGRDVNRFSHNST